MSAPYGATRYQYFIREYKPLVGQLITSTWREAAPRPMDFTLQSRPRMMSRGGPDENIPHCHLFLDPARDRLPQSLPRDPSPAPSQLPAVVSKGGTLSRSGRVDRDRHRPRRLRPVVSESSRGGRDRDHLGGRLVGLRDLTQPAL